jgi:hypothetical protein
MEWLPIESAPMDGTAILICGGKVHSVCSGNDGWYASDRVYMATKYARDDYYIVNDYFYAKPTHWMPLPPPPNA